ncbi:MAG TPA: hypothetical protein VNZ58_05335 [Thermomicrobiales bacterium]|nr:hypothetical protein [Thermomicrobiales bacterium]
MNLKSRLLGIGTASILALGMTSGVMAQNDGNDQGDEESQTVGVAVNLVEGVCSFDLSATDLDFGDLTWDGVEWVAPEAQTLTLSVMDAQTGENCSINATSAGLYYQGEVQEAQVTTERQNDRGDHIGVTIDGTELNRWRPTNVYDGGSGDVDLAVGLNTSNANLDAGHYGGEINFQLGRGR